MMHLAVAALLALAQSNDKTQANKYDDAWETGWVSHCKSIYQSSGKTAGFVLQIGDSITHANQYSQWPRYGSGKTSGPGKDDDLCNWTRAATWGTGNFENGSKNGWYLAAADTSGNRGMTSSSGIDSGMYRTGTGNGGNSMPTDTNQTTAAAKVINVDPTTGYIYNLNITTVANAFNDAQFAVVMLGTNDARHGRMPSDLYADLTAIVSALEGKNIVVILSTAPPSTQFDITPFNTQIRSLAQSLQLPLIDYYQEIMFRQPTAWSTTLISPDGVHPSYGNDAADPYTPGGNPSADQTGTNAATDGYLLRSWLTIQKLKEVKYYVVDGGTPTPPADADGDGLPDAWEIAHFGNTTSQNGSGNPDGDAYTNAQEYAAGTDPNDPASPAPTPTPTPTPTASSGGGGGGGHKCGGSIAGPVSPWSLLGAALVTMALLRTARKTGF